MKRILAILLVLACSLATAQTTAPDRPQMVVGTQAAFYYPGAFNGSSGVSWCALNSPARLAAEKHLGIQTYREWQIIPPNCDPYGNGNQSAILGMIQQAWQEGKPSLPTLTPLNGQAYYSPFPGTPDQVSAWVTQWLDAVEGACGAPAAQVFPWGVSCLNEPFNHAIFWPGKSADIAPCVHAMSTVLRARGVKVVAPSWNGVDPGASPAALAAFERAYQPLLPDVDALDLHGYVQHPGPGISAVAAWSGLPVYSTEFSSGQKQIDPATYASQRATAITEAAQSGLAVMIDYPGVVTPDQMPYGGQPGLIDQNARPNAPYYESFANTIATVSHIKIHEVVPVHPATTQSTPLVVPVTQPAVSGRADLYASEQTDAGKTTIAISATPAAVQSRITNQLVGVSSVPTLYALSDGTYSLHFVVGTETRIVYLYSSGKIEGKARLN